MSYAGGEQTAFVAVKQQQSSQRGAVWRVYVFVNGKRLIRPGFQKRKPAIKLAAMMVQQMLIHGWKTRWEVRDEKGNLVDVNLANLGGKMERGERQEKP
jgi:hypothetical protein